MITELSKAIVTHYNTITTNISGISGVPLSSIAPIYFGVAPDKAPYPFVSYYIIDTKIGTLTTCTDGFDVLIQFNIHDTGTSPLSVMYISDEIIDGYNSVALSGLDGSLVNLQPLGLNINEDGNNDGTIGIVEYGCFIEKIR